MLPCVLGDNRRVQLFAIRDVFHAPKNTIHHTHCECSVTILRRVGVVQFVKVLITTHCNIHIPAMFHSVLQCVQCVVYITLHKFVKKSWFIQTINFHKGPPLAKGKWYANK